MGWTLVCDVLLSGYVGVSPRGHIGLDFAFEH